MYNFWNITLNQLRIKFDCFKILWCLTQGQEEDKDENKITLEIEDTTQPAATTEQRILANLAWLKAYLTDMLVNFVILPNSKLTLIKYINCFFVFATTLTITYMVSQRTCLVMSLCSWSDNQPLCKKRARASTLNFLAWKNVDLTQLSGENRSRLANSNFFLGSRSMELKKMYGEFRSYDDQIQTAVLKTLDSELDKV